MRKGESILFLGDSYTSSEGIDPSGGWPIRFLDLLKRSGCQINRDQLIAKNGWSAAELLEALKSDPPSETFSTLFLCIGVNNQYRKQKPDIFAYELEELLNWIAETFAQSPPKQILLSIPDWSQSPFGQDKNRVEASKEIDHFNRLIEQEADKRKLLFHDWTPLSRKLAEEADMFTQDGLHPSALQYDNLARDLFQKVKHLWIQEK